MAQAKILFSIFLCLASVAVISCYQLDYDDLDFAESRVHLAKHGYGRRPGYGGVHGKPYGGHVNYQGQQGHKPYSHGQGPVHKPHSYGQVNVHKPLIHGQGQVDRPYYHGKGVNKPYGHGQGPVHKPYSHVQRPVHKPYGHGQIPVHKPGLVPTPYNPVVSPVHKPHGYEHHGKKSYRHH